MSFFLFACFLTSQRQIHAIASHTTQDSTLLEAIAVLVASAAPSFNPIIERWRIHDAVEGLQSPLYHAHSDAIKRSGTIRIKPASGSDWNSGGSVVQDFNGDSTQDTCVSGNALNECDLRVAAALPQATIKLDERDGTLGVDRWAQSEITTASPPWNSN